MFFHSAHREITLFSWSSIFLGLGQGTFQYPTFFEVKNAYILVPHSRFKRHILVECRQTDFVQH